MIVRPFEHREFLTRAGPWLEEREAENQLFFRMTGNMVSRPLTEGASPFFATVESDGRVVAVAGMTPPYHLVVSKASPAAVQSLMAHLDGAGIAPSGVNGHAETSARFAEAWAAGHRVTMKIHMRLGVYEAVRTLAPSGVPGRLRPAGEPDLPLLAAWCQAFTREALGAQEQETVDQSAARARRWLSGGGIAIWEDGAPRAMANAVGPSPHGICVNGVYTPPEFRRRGYASACVAALTARLLSEGRRFVCLFTDLSNPTSNSIYQKVGYRRVCDFADWEFQPIP